MNLPENLSPDATRLYELMAANPSSQSVAQLSEAFNSQPTTEGSPKAVGTANSLVVKGMITKEGDGEKTVYTLSKPPVEENTDKEDAEESYTEGEGDLTTNSANAEEQRMIDLIEKNGGKLPEVELFEQYNKEQQPANDNSPSDSSKIEAALKELTAAGVITKDNDNYSVKK